MILLSPSYCHLWVNSSQMVEVLHVLILGTPRLFNTNQPHVAYAFHISETLMLGVGV